MTKLGLCCIEFRDGRRVAPRRRSLTMASLVRPPFARMKQILCPVVKSGPAQQGITGGSAKTNTPALPQARYVFVPFRPYRFADYDRPGIRAVKEVLHFRRKQHSSLIADNSGGAKSVPPKEVSIPPLSFRTLIIRHYSTSLICSSCRTGASAARPAELYKGGSSSILPDRILP